MTYAVRGKSLAILIDTETKLYWHDVVGFNDMHASIKTYREWVREEYSRTGIKGKMSGRQVWDNRYSLRLIFLDDPTTQHDFERLT
jgi:hypothetical protein